MRCKHLIFYFSVAGFLVTILLLYCTQNRYCGKYEEQILEKADEEKVVAEGENHFLDPPKMFPIDEGKKALFKDMFNSVASAYSNCQYEVIEELEEKLPQCVESLLDKDYIEVSTCLYKSLASGLSGKNVLQPRFSNLNEFTSRVRTDIATMRLYGKICLRRRSGGENACRFEALTLKRLKDYREVYVREGKKEFVDIADVFLEEWIGHIESPNSFSKAYALYWIEYSQLWRRDAYGNRQKWEYLLDKAIMQGSKWLVSVGYRPKWIDELKEMTDR